jgi:hypothetical protein
MLQVDYLVVAEAALAANNRHYIHGTIDVLWATAVPVTHPSLSIAIRLRVPWNDANTPFPIEIDLVDPDEESILPERPQGTITMGRPATAIPGEDGLVPLVYNLAMIQFRKAGTHGVVLRMGGRELQRARFQVRLVANRQPVVPTPAQPPSYTPPPQMPQNPPTAPSPAPQPQPPVAQQPPFPPTAPHPPELQRTPPEEPPQIPAPFELLPYAPAQPTPQSPPRPAEDQTTREQYAPPTAPPRQDTPTSNEPPGPPHLPFSLGGLSAAERETPPSTDGSTPRE